MTLTETETQFESWVDDTRKLGGWVATHFRAGRTGGGWSTPVTGDVGYPDWTFVHPDDGRLIIAELKATAGRVELAQRVWLDLLARASVRGRGFAWDVCLWRPEDRPEILDVLLRGKAPSTTRWHPDERETR